MAVPYEDTKFFHAHCHSQFSTIDGTARVGLIADKAHRHGQPGLALTDHGTMAGFVQLYLACKALGIKPWAGIEGYLIDPEREDWETPKKGAAPVGRFHFGLLARNEDGYKALVKFSSMTHTRPRFSRFPRNTLADLVQLGQDHGNNLILTTGCYFGLIQQMIVRGRRKEALNYVKMLSRVFPHLFVEVQHHNICHDDQPQEEGVQPLDDDQMVREMFVIAEKLSLPIIATQDSHYLDMKHKPAHTLMKRMVYASTEDGFPGDGFHLASADWVAEHYTQDQWDRIEEGFDVLDELWDLHIAPLDNYSIHVPTVVKDALKTMVEKSEAGLQKYLDDNPDLDPDPYWERHDEEVDVIDQLNMSAYHVVVADYVHAAQSIEIMVETRGSGNGSLVCFALGITQSDPLIRKGMFARYLSLDRTKPPDIDLDIEDTGRAWLLNYIMSKYEAVQIGTYSMLGSTIDKETGEERGSVLQSYLMYLRRTCAIRAKEALLKKTKKPTEAQIKAYAGGIFNREYGFVKGIEDVRKVSQEDYRGLKKLIEMASVYKSYGSHAAGVLLSGDDVKISDYIPTMLIASSDTTVTQYMGDDVEAFGLLKMDILGQSSLRVMKRCQENMIDAGHDFQGESAIDFTWIPDDDPAACKLLREGRMDTGIFHYEGYTKAKGGREMKIASTEDAILGQALFMPGAMDTGQKDLYIKRRNSAAERKKITYISPEFEKALSNTYGAVIYQEQVIEIMRNLGMDMAGINKFFKVVKDSGKGAVERNRERMAEVRQQFEQLCRKRGIADVDAAWAQTAGFVSYGFNRAHASGYGIRSYRTAYLKAHFPVEYMAALLEVWAGKTKENRYIREARRVGIKLLPPDVNVSGETWSQDFNKNNVVRKGLTSVPGIGEKSAIAISMERPFESMEDLIERVGGRSLTGGKQYLEDGTIMGTIAKLNDVGALDSLL